VPAEVVGWGLTPGREGLSGLPNDEKPARNGFGEAGGIIHHLLWLHPLLLDGRYLALHQEEAGAYLSQATSVTRLLLDSFLRPNTREEDAQSIPLCIAEPAKF
jgi:hypothetical protein